MSYTPGFSATAFLMADPARAAMLTVLLDGRALPAGELAYASGVTAQTASSHLAKLLEGGLLAVETEGRHRYYRLAGFHIAQALEQLAAIQSEIPVRRKALSPQARQLRFARCCYDHLAGQIGVAVTCGLQQRGYIVATHDKQFAITPAGIDWFGGIGLDVGTIRPTRRGVARQCLDWTERTHHLAGPLGVRLLSVLCGSAWLRRTQNSRAVEITPKGWMELRRHFGINAIELRAA